MQGLSEASLVIFVSFLRFDCPTQTWMSNEKALIQELRVSDLRHADRESSCLMVAVQLAAVDSMNCEH